MKPRILVAGIGNIFKADDGFGVEVIRAFSDFPQDECVQVVDFGIRGLDLAYTLLDGDYDLVILVDAVQRGGRPGTLYVIEPDFGSSSRDQDEKIAVETHGMHPAQVLGWVSSLEARLGAVRLVGCEPAELASDEELKMGLSGPVKAAVPEAVRTVEELIAEALCTS